MGAILCSWCPAYRAESCFLDAGSLMGSLNAYTIPYVKERIDSFIDLYKSARDISQQYEAVNKPSSSDKRSDGKSIIFIESLASISTRRTKAERVVDLLFPCGTVLTDAVMVQLMNIINDNK